jgi:hypothetical protein
LSVQDTQREAETERERVRERERERERERSELQSRLDQRSSFPLSNQTNECMAFHPLFSPSRATMQRHAHTHALALSWLGGQLNARLAR